MIITNHYVENACVSFQWNVEIKHHGSHQALRFQYRHILFVANTCLGNCVECFPNISFPIDYHF